MKRISIAFILCGLAFLTSCKLQKEGLVVMTDNSYKASVFATNKMGFGSPDGLIWHKGKLYIAEIDFRGKCPVYFIFDKPGDLLFEKNGNKESQQKEYEDTDARDLQYFSENFHSC